MINKYQALPAKFVTDATVESCAPWTREEPCRMRLEQDVDDITAYLARQDIYAVWREDIQHWLQTTQRSSLLYSTRMLAELYLLYAANAMLTSEDRKMYMEGIQS